MSPEPDEPNYSMPFYNCLGETALVVFPRMKVLVSRPGSGLLHRAYCHRFPLVFLALLFANYRVYEPGVRHTSFFPLVTSVSAQGSTHVGAHHACYKMETS